MSCAGILKRLLLNHLVSNSHAVRFITMIITITTKEGVKVSFNKVERGHIDLKPNTTQYMFDGFHITDDLHDTIENKTIKSITIEY